MPPTESERDLRIAIVGGDRRTIRDLQTTRSIRHFASRRAAGTGELRRLQTALRSGLYDVLILFTRFLGHSMARAAKQIAHAVGVPVRMVSSGRSQLVRLLREPNLAAG